MSTFLMGNFASLFSAEYVEISVDILNLNIVLVRSHLYNKYQEIILIKSYVTSTNGNNLLYIPHVQIANVMNSTANFAIHIKNQG